jgi:aminoglycoside phosphotransferase
MVAGPPRRRVPEPACVAATAGDTPFRVVWENERGGLTFEIGRGPTRRFIKWSPVDAEIDLGAEAVRTKWAARYTAAPVVIDLDSDANGSWLVTAGLAGESAASDRWRRSPTKAVRAIGAGLRAFHDALPAADCPFSWSAENRLADARSRAAADRLRPSRWHPEHQDLDVHEALGRIAATPSIDRLVVCHGDACVPNTLIGDDGHAIGHVDLGRLGVADRWADLAVATWSTEWNFGGGHEQELLDAYGVEADAERSAYYRLLWDL